MSRAKVIHVVTRLDLGGAQQNTLYTAAHLDPARDLYQQRREELVKLMKAGKSRHLEIPSHFEVGAGLPPAN